MRKATWTACAAFVFLAAGSGSAQEAVPDRLAALEARLAAVETRLQEVSAKLDRILAALEGRTSPGAAERRNLIRNGAFKGLDGWTAFHSSNVRDRFEVVAEGGACRWSRTNSRNDGGAAGAVQDLDADVSTARAPWCSRSRRRWTLTR